MPSAQRYLNQTHRRWIETVCSAAWELDIGTSMWIIRQGEIGQSSDKSKPLPDPAFCLPPISVTTVPQFEENPMLRAHERSEREISRDYGVQPVHLARE